MQITSLLSRWSSYFAASPLRTMGHTAAIAAITSLIAKVAAFGKELTIASSFGLSGELDVYLVAFVLIGVPLSILINATQATLITHLASAQLSKETSNGRLVATSLLTLACLAVMLPVWLLALPHILPWITSGFSEEKRLALATALYWLVPHYFLSGLNLLGYGTLQATGRYVSNGLIPIATPIVTILTLLVSGVSDCWQILVASLTMGTLLESLLILATLNLAGKIRLTKTDIKCACDVMRSSLAILPGTVMLTIGPVVEQSIAAALGNGSNAALSYGYKLPTAIQGIIVTAIGVTALPYFSKQLGLGKISYCLHSLKKLSLVLLLCGFSLALPLCLLSTQITELIYQRGAFDLKATTLVAPIQLAFFVQIPFSLVAMLCIKALTAMRLNLLISICIATSVMLQAPLAYWLSHAHGIAGIAWAATIVAASLALTLFSIAYKRLLTLIKPDQ